MMRDRRGSSLVEVLAAVTVLALLASVVGGAMVGVFPRVRLQAWRASMRGLQSACDTFYARWGTYPVTGGVPPPEGPLAWPLDLQAPGGDGRPFAATLRSLPPGDAREAGLAREPLPLYYGVNRLGRVFATTTPPPWGADTVVFLPETPEGAALGTGLAPGRGGPAGPLPGAGDVADGGGAPGGGQVPGDGHVPGGGQVPGGVPVGEPAPGEGELPSAGGGGPGDPGGAQPVELVPGGAGPAAALLAGVGERDGALVPLPGPTLGPDRSLPVPVSGAGAAVLGAGIYLLGGRGNASGILYQPGPDAEWQLLPTRLPHEVENATVVAVGGRAYLLGGGPGEAGREVWVYEGLGKSLRRLDCTFPAPLAGAGACVQAGRVYVFGGYLAGAPSAAIFAFDPEQGTITRLPATLPVPLVGAAAVALGDDIYLFGGRTAQGWSDRILRYSPGDGTLQDTGHRLPVGAARPAVAALGGVAYLLGGACGEPANPSPLSSLWSYTPGEGIHGLTPALAFAPGCWGAAAVTRGDEVYFCGGASSAGVDLARVLRLRWEAGSPRPVLTLSTPLACAGVVAGRGGDLYVLGGVPYIRATSQVRRVSLRDRREQVLGFALPVEVMNAPCVRVGNRIFVFGGRTRYGSLGRRLSTIAVVDLDSGTAGVVGSLPWAVEGSAAAAWGGAVYILGGCTDSGLNDRILRFDPVTFSLEELPLRLPSAREQAGAVSSAEGIWLVGGRGPTGILDEVLLLHPGDGSLRQAARLPVPLQRPAAVHWQGRLYVMGGITPQGLSARILELGGDGSVHEVARPLPAPACGTAAVVDGVIYLVTDLGAVQEVVPRPMALWLLDGGDAASWRLAALRATGVTLSFRVSADAVQWTAEAGDPSRLPPGRYLEVRAAFRPEESTRLERLSLAR